MSRVTPHHALTAKANPNAIQIIYDAELKGLSMCDQCYNCCCLCMMYDQSRSYLYLRENSIESNIVYKYLCPCCICGGLMCCKRQGDNVQVDYFDQPPYKPSCCWYCCGMTNPKLEVVEEGCLCCCIPINCGSKVVVMPFERLPFPCCCCSNRTGLCDNCCGCCGQFTGTPKYYHSFMPQPKSSQEFVAVAQQIMKGGGGRTIAPGQEPKVHPLPSAAAGEVS